MVKALIPSADSLLIIIAIILRPFPSFFFVFVLVFLFFFFFLNFFFALFFVFASFVFSFCFVLFSLLIEMNVRLLVLYVCFVHVAFRCGKIRVAAFHLFLLLHLTCCFVDNYKTINFVFFFFFSYFFFVVVFLFLFFFVFVFFFVWFFFQT